MLFKGRGFSRTLLVLCLFNEQDQLFLPMTGCRWLCAGGQLCLEFLIIFCPSSFLSIDQNSTVVLSKPALQQEEDLSVSQAPRWEFKRQHAMLLLRSKSWFDAFCICSLLKSIKVNVGENKTAEAKIYLWITSEKCFSLWKGGHRFIHPANSL